MPTFVLVGVVVVAAWLFTFALVLSPAQEHADQSRLYAQLRAKLADPPPPVAVARPGTARFLLDVPRVGLHRAVVVEGVSSGTLRKGPGHRMGSAMPGQPGVAVVFGRSVTFGAPFAHLGTLHAGDTIVVTTDQGRFPYTVNDVRGSGDPAPSSFGTGAHLMLVTSQGSGWRRGWAPDQTIFVDATLVGKPAAAPAPVAVAATSRTLPMQGDAAALGPLVLWLQALLLAVLGFVAAARRWGLWQMWIVGAPVTVALAWAASDSLFTLLPNLL